jgi:hypothetical protein
MPKKGVFSGWKFLKIPLAFFFFFRYNLNKWRSRMKKVIIAVVFAAFLVAGLPLFAQQNKEGRLESEYYYVNVTLEKVFPYRAGYVVQYRKGIGQIGTNYLPIEWFSAAASKGELVMLPKGIAWPSMSVYYKNGEFSHVRLYVHRQYSHSTWGSIPQTVNIDDRFQGVDSIPLQF